MIADRKATAAGAHRCARAFYYRGLRVGATFRRRFDDTTYSTFDDLAGWETLGARCSKCEREGWLDCYERARRFSGKAHLSSLTSRLRRRKCGNAAANKFILEGCPGIEATFRKAQCPLEVSFEPRPQSSTNTPTI